MQTTRKNYQLLIPLPRIAAALAASLMVVLAFAGRALADAVAVVVSLSGSPTVRVGGTGAERPLKLFEKLETGDVVRCDGASEAILNLSGARYKVAGGNTATVTADGVRGGQKTSSLKGPSSRLVGGMVAARTSGLLGRPGTSYSPITPAYPGYLKEGTRKIDWAPVPGAAQYDFTLADTLGNIVYHARETETAVTLPEEVLAQIRPASPYVWRLAPLGKTGKAIAQAAVRWGVLTFLSDADAATLEAEAKELRSEITPDDTTAVVLLIELYRQKGVYDKVLELLSEAALSQEQNGQMAAKPGVVEERERAYKALGPFAYMLAHPLPD
mgnify:FL=1|jgi:hypothetical protein